MDAWLSVSRCSLVRLLLRATYAVLAGGLALTAAGQTLDETGTAPLATPESIQQRITEAEASMLDADTKTRIAARYRAALQELSKIAEAKLSVERFQTETRAAVDNVARYKADLDQVIRQPRPDILKTTSLEELDALRLEQEAALNLQKQTLKDIETTRQQRAERRNEIRRLQSDAEVKRTELRQQAAAAAPEGEPTALTEARRMEASLRLRAFESQLSANEFELQKYQAEETVGLLTHRASLTQKRIERAEEFVRRLADQVSVRRRQEAEAAIHEAERAKLMADPLLEPLAKQNLADAEDHRKFGTKIEGITREIKQTQDDLERQQARYADIRMKEADIGLTRPIGLLLREQRESFPDLRELQRQLNARQDLIDQARLLSWKYADELKNLRDARTIVREASATAALTYEQRDELERLAADLLDSRRVILTELKRSSEQYFNALCDRDTIDHRYLQSCRDYLQYINERILWIRSADPLTPSHISADSENRDWLFATRNWWMVLQVVAADPFEHPFAFWPTVLAVASLFYVRLSIRPRLRAFGVNAGKRGFLRYGPTGQAAVLTCMSAITAPAALLFLSWRLAEGVDPTNFVRSVATAIQTCAIVLFPVELLREACRHLGLAEAHFAWPTRAVAHLRRVLTWTKSVGIVVTFFAVLAHEHQTLSGGTPTERVLFIGGMLLAALTLHRLLEGSGEFAKSLAIDLPNNLFSRFRRLWYACTMAVPLALAVLAGLGYHYSAIQLADRLIWTLWLAGGLVLVRGMATRWVVLSRRRLLLDQAYQRRAAAAAAEESGEINDTPKPPLIEETDVARSTQQTRKFVNIFVFGLAAMGAAMIWAETLPAFGLLDRPLWEVEQANVPAPVGDPLTGVGAASSGSDQAAAASQRTAGSLSVTTLDVGIAMLLALFTFLASRNLPGLMEMSVLTRLPVDHATRYAATRLASYAIIIVGVCMATNRLGLRWQNVQWLVAALTVGLGFGLQEVFANFVSGLIILFERPIRVGDIVTIDDVSGVVSKIRMRATTITNWDRKEFIVPNREFITGRVLNWTLSDAVNRISISVGVAYGSDTDKVRCILLKICDEQPLLMKDPAPTAIFEAFGESMLNFTLRCFLPSLDGRADTIHELHTRIVEEFKKADIEIAIPRRDLRISSVDRAILPMTIAAERAEAAAPLERVAG